VYYDEGDEAQSEPAVPEEVVKVEPESELDVGTLLTIRPTFPYVTTDERPRPEADSLRTP